MSIEIIDIKVKVYGIMFINISIDKEVDSASLNSTLCKH